MAVQGLKKKISEASSHVVISCYPDTPVHELLFGLQEHNFLVVTRKGDGQVAGLVSRIDVVKAYLEDPDWEDKPVSDLMTPEERLIWLPNHVDLSEAVKKMVDRDIHQLVVYGPAEGGRHPTGVITLADVIRELRAETQG